MKTVNILLFKANEVKEEVEKEEKSETFIVVSECRHNVCLCVRALIHTIHTGPNTYTDLHSANDLNIR